MSDLSLDVIRRVGGNTIAQDRYIIDAERVIRIRNWQPMTATAWRRVLHG